MLFFIHLFIKATLLLLVVGGLLLILQKETAQVRHFLISRMMLGLLLLPMLLSFIPSLEVELPFLTATIEKQLPVNTKESILPTAYVTIKQEIVETALPSVTIDKVEKKAITSLSKASEIEPIRATKSYIPTFSTTQLLFFIWFIGGLFVLFRFGLGFYLVRQITRGAKPFLLSDDLESQLHILTKKRVAVFSSSRVNTPMTWGFLKPIILLPTTAVHWEKDLLKIVLIHEGMHIYRADYWWHIIGLLTLSCYWWHPLIWVFKKQQVLEREKACDEAVLQEGIPIETYAQSLVTVAKNLSKYTRQAQSALAMATISQTKKRIMAILNFQNSKPQSLKAVQWLAVLFLIGTLPLLAGLHPVATLSTPSISKTILTTAELPAKEKDFVPIDEANMPIITTVIESNTLETPSPVRSQNLSITSPKSMRFSTLPKLTTRLPIASSSQIIKAPPMSTPKKQFISEESRTLPKIEEEAYIETQKGLYGTWKNRRSTYKVYTHGEFTILSALPYIRPNSTEALIVIEETRKTLLGDKKYRLVITQAPNGGSMVQSFQNGAPNSWSGSYQKGDPLLLWWENEEWGGFKVKGRDKWIAKHLSDIAVALKYRTHRNVIEVVDKDNASWWSKIQEQETIKQKRFKSDAVIQTVVNKRTQEGLAREAERTAASTKLVDFPYQALTDKVKSAYKQKVGRTIPAKTKSGCSGCSNITKTKFGTVIKTSTQPAIIETINIHLADNKFKSIQFKLHLYKVKNGQIQHRLTEQAALFTIGQEEGWVRADLSAYNISIQGDVLVMLEPIEVKGRKRMLFFSLSPTFWMYPGFHKKNTQSVEDFWDNSFALYFTLQ